jgi:hypothetical protein
LPSDTEPGGAPQSADFVYHAHALGVKAVPVSAIGDDDLGRGIVEKNKPIEFSNRIISFMCLKSGAMPVLPDHLCRF